MMDIGKLLRSTWEFVPILMLLFGGAMIAMRSGADGRAAGEGLRRALANLSHILVRLLAYAAAMLLVNEWIGIRPGLGW